MLVNVLVIPLDRPNHRVLLGLKKHGFGQGRYVGFGGKLEGDETLAQAAARELKEESGLFAKPHNLWYAARLEFVFPGKPDWDRVVHVFRLEFWDGEPQESDEVVPEWFGLDELPLERMWDDAAYWLPKMLLGLKQNLRFTYAADNLKVERAEELE